MVEVTFPTQRLWHWAVSPIHQTVALGAFLYTAREAGVAVYYAADDATARRIRHAARLLDIPVGRGFRDDSRHTEAQGERRWWWIGTHGHRGEDGCPVSMWREGTRPEVSLCLFEWDPSGGVPPPDGHRPYITGQDI
jgi:hypothetical protein